jgi:MFS family permease
MMVSVMGMYSMYVIKLGFTKKEVSIAATLVTIAGLIGQSFIGYLVDKYKTIKKILLFCISLGFVLAIGISFTQVTWHIYILIFIWGFFVAGTAPLSEIWALETLKKYNEQRNFGRVRGFGSIGYGFSGAFIGVLLQRFGWGMYHWYIIIALTATMSAIMLIKDGERSITSNVKTDKKEKISLKEAFSIIFKTKPLLVIITIMFAYNFVMRGIYSYLGILVSDFGGGAQSLGLTYFFDASPEMITFFLAGALIKKFNSKKVIFFAFLLQIIRLSVILIFNNAAAVISMGVLSGLAFGLVTASYKTYLFEIAPEKYRASCMSLSDSIIGFSAIISAPVFGFVFTQFGTNAAITFGLVVFVLSVLVMLKDILKPNKVMQNAAQ